MAPAHQFGLLLLYKPADRQFQLNACRAAQRNAEILVVQKH